MLPLTITIIQPDLVWQDKQANLNRLFEKIESINNRTEVVLLPEMFSTGFSMNTELLAEQMNGPTIEWMKRIAASKKIILAGSIIIEEGGKYYNRFIWMLPNGQYGFYDKRHLFAFAHEDKHFSPGSKRVIASVKGWKINLLVCYDLRFPVWARQNPLSAGNIKDTSLQQAGGTAEYDVLVYIANWPEKRSTAWKTLLQARAIENQSYVVGVNRVGIDGNNIKYSGDSMLIDPLGEILYQNTGEEDVFTFTLHKERLSEVRDTFPFWKDADEFKL